MNYNKMTRATFRAFIKKNDNLFINVKSQFDGMIDGIRFHDDGFEPVQKTEKLMEYTFGIAGVWLVGRSRDYFDIYEDDNYTGIKVINSCGSFIIAKKRGNK